MRIGTNAQGFETTTAIDNFIRDEVELKFDPFRDQVISIDVFMKDINGPKGGVDKQVVVKARLRNRQRIALETTHENLYAALKLGLRKSRRAVRRSLRKSGRIDRLSVRKLLLKDHVTV